MANRSCDLRLRPGAERVLEAAAAARFAGQLSYRLQLQAERLALVAGFDELVCLDALNFIPFDYQVKAAQTALRRFRGRGLLCDEVGLGKTIEAGLVLKEYLLRQMANRVLIITPPARSRKTPLLTKGCLTILIRFHTFFSYLISLFMYFSSNNT